ncbi:bifunctional transcriptional activator/DNA repair enzyme AdaA [Flagellimonas profundi]|uniref:Bifunctional transcriptional activator/DNA repair protein Ada n=1 Tax=Flagellimonas profundi TaxID=2915620 RepID=A0ABS3FKC9_9FLAO|nr:bifunctional transcriptional activator/DNA repair protein Ada [Allomuricauda profundi]MBO0343493.1 bifunctional transcriptional activator/DNA repair protein Ada [Allomuricauda profundi]
MRITETKTIDTYYEALLARREDFVGIFFVGVKTTSVFCIATCRARKPKKKNVEFFTSFKDALDNGYRPCKVCKPTENANEAPEPVQIAIRLVKENPKSKISDNQLRQLNVSPEVVRRWFNKNYGMTFQSYQRMYRINVAFQELKQGKNTTETAFDSGYESLSGFGYTFKKLVGNSPRNSTAENVILISRLTTPLGPMFVCATKKGVCLLEFADRKMLETAFRSLQNLLNAHIIAGENNHIKQTQKEITEYFDGTRQKFEIPLETPGTDFQIRVWKNLQKIPFGTTSTYTEQAQILNSHNAVRALASANGHNRVSIIVPCHRVLGKNGNLVGYGGGVQRKKWLLDHEQKFHQQVP